MDERPARRLTDFTGAVMRASASHGKEWNFHALMTIDGPPGRQYMNWSYRSGRFEVVTEKARHGLHLDPTAKCTPVAHFARNLSLF